MIAVFDIVPVEPSNRVKPDAEAMRLADGVALREDVLPNLAVVIVAPEQRQNVAFVVGVNLAVGLFGVGSRGEISGDGLPVLNFVLLGSQLDLADKVALEDEDIGLALNEPVSRVAEKDMGVIEDFSTDSTLDFLT